MVGVPGLGTAITRASRLHIPLRGDEPSLGLGGCI